MYQSSPGSFIYKNLINPQTIPREGYCCLHFTTEVRNAQDAAQAHPTGPGLTPRPTPPTRLILQQKKKSLMHPVHQ